MVYQRSEIKFDTRGERREWRSRRETRVESGRAVAFLLNRGEMGKEERAEKERGRLGLRLL